MAEGLVNPLDSYAANQIKSFRASEPEVVVGKAGSVCNSQSGRQEVKGPGR